MTLSEVDQLCSVLKDRYGNEFSHIAHNKAKEQYITLYLKVRLPNGNLWYLNIFLLRTRYLVGF